MKPVLRSLIALLVLSPAPPALNAQQAAVGLGYGAQSRSPHPRIVAAQAALGVGGDSRAAFLLAPAVTMAMRDGLTGWRAHVALETRFRWRPVVPYLGVGASWTSQKTDADWTASEWGMVMLTGVDVILTQLTPRGLILAAFLEVSAYTQGYAPGQVLAGLRLVALP